MRMNILKESKTPGEIYDGKKFEQRNMFELYDREKILRKSNKFEL